MSAAEALVQEKLAKLRALAKTMPGAWDFPDAARRVPTGFAELDDALGGGLGRGALNEIHVAGAGSGALEALLPCLERAGSGRRLLAWIHPTRAPYPPALVQTGGDLRRWLIVRPPSEDEHQWAIDQALRAGACDAVVAFVGDLDDRRLRRLQLAAETGDTLAILFRPGALATRPSPAPVRLSAEPIPSPDPEHRRVRFHLLRCRGLTAPVAIDVSWSRTPLARPAPA